MSSMRTRSRSLPFTVGGGTLYEKSEDTFPPYLKTDVTSVGVPDTIYGSQITDSEGHPFKHRSGANIGDVGGEFHTVRQYITGANSAVDIVDQYSANGINHDVKYHGTALPIVPDADLFPPIRPLSAFRDEMEEDGATAVARVKPTNPIADLSTALGELRTEGVPKIPGISTWESQTKEARKRSRSDAGIRGAKTGSSEFLGVQFGVLPFVGDIKDIARGVSDADRILAQYRRDSGKLVRRRYEFPIHEEFSSEVIATNRKPILAKDTSHIYTVIPAGDLICDTKKVTAKVFSGGFTYHIPGDYPGVSEMSNSALYAKKILGLDLSPDTVWNLTPWSWALDWFSNTGDVIDNLSDYATDGLVLRYGYIQRHVTESKTYYLSSFDGTALSFVTETKSRVRANPFGFGLTWEGLTPRQLAISVALGIDRVL